MQNSLLAIFDKIPCTIVQGVLSNFGTDKKLSTMGNPDSSHCGYMLIVTCYPLSFLFFLPSPLSLSIFIQRYDPVTNTWQFVQSMNVCRGGVGLTTLGQYLCAVGGHDGKVYLNSAEMYDPKRDKWEIISSMNTSRAGAGLVTLDASTFSLPGCISIPESLYSL